MKSKWPTNILENSNPMQLTNRADYNSVYLLWDVHLHVPLLLHKLIWITRKSSRQLIYMYSVQKTNETHFICIT